MAKEYPRHIVFVTGIIENEQGELLLLKSPFRPGWEPPGGQVELGEDLIAALERETKEETGYDIEVLKLISVVQNTGSEKSEPKVGFVFKGRVIGGTACTSSESLEVGWFSREEALEKVSYGPTLDRLRDALNFDGTVRFKAYKNKPYRVVRQL